MSLNFCTKCEHVTLYVLQKFKIKGQSVKTSSDPQIIAPRVAESNGDDRILIRRREFVRLRSTKLVGNSPEQCPTPLPQASICRHGRLEQRRIVTETSMIVYSGREECGDGGISCERILRGQNKLSSTFV